MGRIHPDSARALAVAGMEAEFVQQNLDKAESWYTRARAAPGGHRKEYVLRCSLRIRAKKAQREAAALQIQNAWRCHKGQQSFMDIIRLIARRKRLAMEGKKGDILCCPGAQQALSIPRIIRRV